MVYYVGSDTYGRRMCLAHYGLKGMHWGTRRWQYQDGRFNEEGKLRYFGVSSPHRPPSVVAESGGDHDSSSKTTKTSARYSPSVKAGTNRSLSSNSRRTTGASKQSPVTGKSLTDKPHSTSSSKKNGDTFWTEERKATAKKVAIVAGVVAASYVAYKVAKPHLLEVEAGANFMTTRNATQLSKTPLSKISDDDGVIKTGTEVQRIIRDYHNPDKALSMDSAKKFIYGATDRDDKRIYRTMFRSKGEGKNMITTRLVTNDIKMPSPRKRVSSFVDLMGDRKFAEAFAEDIRTRGQIGADKTITADRILSMTPQQKQELYSRFNMIAGDAKSKSAPMYFSKIRDMGYGALVDDNDAGFLSYSPKIFLNASDDTVVIGSRYAKRLEKVMDGVKLKHILGKGSLH